jgi:archaellum component FlaC
MNEIFGFAAVIVSILAAQLFNNSRLNAVEARLESRIDRLVTEINRVQTETNTRMDRMQSELTARIDRIQADLAQFYRDLGRHDEKIESIEKKIGE